MAAYRCRTPLYMTKMSIECTRDRVRARQTSRHAKCYTLHCFLMISCVCFGVFLVHFFELHFRDRRHMWSIMTRVTDNTCDRSAYFFALASIDTEKWTKNGMHQPIRKSVGVDICMPVRAELSTHGTPLVQVYICMHCQRLEHEKIGEWWPLLINRIIRCVTGLKAAAASSIDIKAMH